MHTAMQWTIQHLGLIVALPLAASLGFLVESLYQVQRKLQRQKQENERELLKTATRIKAALTGQTGQQVNDEPKKHAEVFAPSGQNVSTPFREDRTIAGII